MQRRFLTEYEPTIEDSYRKQVAVDEQNVMLDILDTAGQEEYAALRDQYMMTGEGFILAFSLVDRTTYDELKALHLQILKVKGSSAVPIVLVGNKLDLATREPAKRAVPASEALKLAGEWGVQYFEASAKDGTNVDESWRPLVRLVRKATPAPKRAASVASSPAASASAQKVRPAADSEAECKCVVC